MLIFENKEQKLLNLLKFTGSPFKKFVSTGEIKEDIRLVQSRQDFVQSIINVLEKDENLILPIIGDVGTGKTHLYWALKHELYYYNIVYISLENVIKKFYYNTYSEFIENMGIEVLRNIARRLCNEWGALDRKFGFFHLGDIEKVKKVACENWAPNFENKAAIMDVINALTAHQLDPYKKIEAERWFLGEVIDIRDLSRLNLKHDLRERNNSYTMLKVLVENAMVSSVLFIDDFEKIISMIKPISIEEETEEVFDRSWLYGTKQSPEKRIADKVLDKILNLNKINGLKIIITIKSPEYYKEIISEIEDKNSFLLDVVKEPIILSNFIKEDLFTFYKRNLEFFFGQINYFDYFRDFSNSYYPLNEEVLKYIYNQTKGNPREIIKLLIKIFNDIVLSNDNLEEVLKNYQ
ncbi:MAG: hypothetical protein CEE43_16180 [Promethearchaeota archaeon Loki_b32]|nr:MAG: hypothetical protein CEE43_16180 [Candidatus Lokiarchaeota archaeon Loki_b32]